MHKLKAWKTSSRRKPLLVMGARQVGKTTLLRQFGKEEYRNVVEINFDSRPDLKSLFDSNLSPQRILRDISIEFDVDINPKRYPIIFR